MEVEANGNWQPKIIAASLALKKKRISRETLMNQLAHKKQQQQIKLVKKNNMVEEPADFLGLKAKQPETRRSFWDRECTKRSHQL